MNKIRHDISRIRVAIVSIVAGLLILGLKWIAYNLTGSSALKSDALESIVNVVAACFALGALIFADQPADKDHPYGHGKIEFFSAAFEGGLISLAAILIIFDAGKTLYEGAHLMQLEKGLGINLVAGLLNGLLGWYLVRRGKQTHSEALTADGQHVLSDFYTTLGLLAGLCLVWITGYHWLDPVIALGVGLMLVRTGFKLVSKSADALLDKQDLTLLGQIVGLIESTKPKEIIALHEMRAMRSGHHSHIDVHVVVPEYFTIAKAHDLVEFYGESIIKQAGISGEFHSHVDPCGRLYCASCDLSECKIRTEPLKSAFKVNIETVQQLGHNHSSAETASVSVNG